MPAFHVQRSLEVGADPATCHAFVREFRNWPQWSPWLIADPDGALDFGDDGRGYSWKGPVAGEGSMEVVGEEVPARIDYALEFRKPFRSEASVRLAFEEAGGSTRITWTMDGALPLPLFWMKRIMTTFIGMDYERGLTMLKDRIETGTVPSALHFAGIGEFAGFDYAGLRTTASIADVAKSMERQWEALKREAEESGIEATGPPFAIYHVWKPTRDLVDYTLGFPVERPTPGQGGLHFDQIPACRTYQIRHTGPYRHLGNAWASGMMHVRAKRFRTRRGFPPFEIYESDPEATPENDLVTEIHMPAREASSGGPTR